MGYIPNNPYKQNQDNFVLAPNLLNQPALHYFAVCDGHGQYGKDVSTYVKHTLPLNLEDELKMHAPDVPLALSNSFLKCNSEMGPHIPDPQFSGTTCCSLLMNGTKIYTANAGDSRAIVVNKNGHCRALTRDHKPDLPEEEARILNCGGRIEAFRDAQTGEEMGPKRVWVLNEDVPGLAMSRSLGDYVAQSVGVLPDPG